MYYEKQTPEQGLACHPDDKLILTADLSSAESELDEEAKALYHKVLSSECDSTSNISNSQYLYHLTYGRISNSQYLYHLACGRISNSQYLYHLTYGRIFKTLAQRDCG